jgi:hypothetical protein
MSDKSPRQGMSKKSGKSLKEKRVAKNAKAAAKLSAVEAIVDHKKREAYEPVRTRLKAIAAQRVSRLSTVVASSAAAAAITMVCARSASVCTGTTNSTILLP